MFHRPEITIETSSTRYGSRSFFIYNAFWTNQPAVDAVCKGILEPSMPYQTLKLHHFLKGYKTLPFPFEPVLENGQSSEGNPNVT